MKKKETKPSRNMVKVCFVNFSFSLSIFIVLFFLSTSIYGQGTKMISGKVTDADGLPLPGATVLEEGTSNGTITNMDGIYSLKVKENATLVFSFVGMKLKSVKLANQSEIDVQLESANIGLDEVVAIGYGTQSRRTLTTSVSKVSSKKLEDVAVSSLSTAIQGKTSGVRVYQSSGGMPGSSSTIRVRGGSSINRSNDPLVIVDGLPRSMSDVNINDIESIEVFKDASSTAIYGARASNGVVYITTKKGKRGKAEIKFNVSAGISSPWKYMDMVSGYDYLRLTREAIARSPDANLLTERARGAGTGNDDDSPWSTRYLEDGETVPDGYKTMPDPVDESKTLIYQDNDFQKLALRKAVEQSYYLSANGGSDRILYSAGIGYDNQEGISIGTKWERFSAKMNVDFKLKENLMLSTKVNHTTSYTNTWPSQHAMFSRSIWMCPTARVYMTDGSLGYGLNETYTNPLFYNDVHDYDKYYYKSQFGTSLKWDILDGLTAKVNADYMKSDYTAEYFYKSNVYSTSRSTNFSYALTKTTQFEGVLTYAKSYGKHNFNAVLGGSYIYYDNLSAFTGANGGSTDKIQTLNAAPNPTDAYTYRSDEVLLGFFGRLTYNYDKKYMASFSIRRDASSRFAEDNRVGYFPGVSLGWMVSEEPFLKDNPTVNSLKLRTSYGQTGNNSVDMYDAWGEYSVGYDYASEAGTFPTSMPNFGLGWETTNQFDIGFDLGLLKNSRILILADYYNKITHDLLFETDLPNTSGFSSILSNIGKVKYYGFDLDVKVNAIDRKAFKWDVDFNISYNKNEVLELPNNGRPQNRIGGVYNSSTDVGVGGIAEGEPLDQLYGFKADFIIDDWDEANNANYDNFAVGYNPEDGTTEKGRKIPGDMEWVDKDGDEDIDVYDQFIIGNQRPHTIGGLSNNLRYKNFELKIFTDYAIGHSISDKVIRRADGNAMDGVYRPTTNVLSAWREIGDVAAGKAKMPRYDYHDAGQQKNIHRGSYNTSSSTYRGDFLCIREIKLGYNAPKEVAKKMGFNNLYVFFSGQNLYYFTKYPGFVPEFQGTDNHQSGSYPIPRKFNVGIKIGL